MRRDWWTSNRIWFTLFIAVLVGFGAFLGVRLAPAFDHQVEIKQCIDSGRTRAECSQP